MALTPRVSLIATVLNEEDSLTSWIDAIDAQTVSPDQIIVVDGGSTDQTATLLETWAVRRPGVVTTFVVPGASISAGRNRALDRAAGDIIAITDAGTVAHPAWLEHLVDAFRDEDVDVASGFWTVRQTSRWERALGAATMPDADDIRPAAFLPSSRSVALRRGWIAAGVRYPEWIDFCEDLIFDLSLRRAGARFAFVPAATVEFQVRPDVRAFWRQYRQYARGDGKAGLFVRRHVLRYITYATLAAVLVRRRPHELGIVSVAGAAYVARPIRRLFRRQDADGGGVRRVMTDLPLTIALVLLGDVAKMVGYPQGLRWRRQRFGRLGKRTSWNRVSPEGVRQRPETWTTESRGSTSRHAGESPQ